MPAEKSYRETSAGIILIKCCLYLKFMLYRNGKEHYGSSIYRIYQNLKTVSVHKTDIYGMPNATKINEVR